MAAFRPAKAAGACSFLGEAQVSRLPEELKRLGRVGFDVLIEPHVSFSAIQ